MESNNRYRLYEGGRINRSRPLTFVFDGRRYQGYEGDTLASALLANGKRVVGRSFKYHRPRGLISAGSEECNALVQLESHAYSEPCARATLTSLYDDLYAKSQNCWPSAEWDIHAATGLFSKFLPAGFYYKTFIWPSWHFWEGFVRRAAGLGKLPEKADPHEYHKRYAHCDLLIVGSGPAGLMAALSAAKAGLRVMLVDEQEELGGSLLWETDQIQGLSADEWLQETLDALAGFSNVTMMSRCTASGYYEHNLLVLSERVTNHLGKKVANDLPRQRLWKVRAKQVVLATGAIERPLVFPNNDRPGIMLASAVRHYLKRYAALAGGELLLQPIMTMPTVRRLTY